MKQNKKWLIGAILLCLAGAGGGFYYKNSMKPTAVEAATAEVVRGNIHSTVSATGTISAVNSVDISSRVTGLIREVKVKENDMVKAG